MQNLKKLYCTVGQSFAMNRCSANVLLRNEKSWSFDGNIVEKNDRSAFIDAYDYTELLKIATPTPINFEITGNTEIDIANAVKTIVKYMTKLAPFPFRVWNGSDYSPKFGGSSRVMIGQNGIASVISKNGNGSFFEQELPKHYSVEVFTGFVDKNWTMVFDNDVVLMDGKAYTVRLDGNWKMSNSEESFDIFQKLGQFSVIGSRRMDKSTIAAITKLIQ